MTDKIIITGCTCAGKTTLGEKIANRLSLAQIDLDEYYFLPNWREKSRDVFLEDVDNALRGKEGWVVSGNYNTLLKDTIWQQADTIIWLNYSLGVVLHRYFFRTYRRVVLKESCCGGNYETLERTFSKDSLFLWIFKSYWRRKERMKNWKAGFFADKKWVVLSNLKETSQYLEQLQACK